MQQRCQLKSLRLYIYVWYWSRTMRMCFYITVRFSDCFTSVWRRAELLCQTAVVVMFPAAAQAVCLKGIRKRPFLGRNLASPLLILALSLSLNYFATILFSFPHLFPLSTPHSSVSTVTVSFQYDFLI